MILILLISFYSCIRSDWSWNWWGAVRHTPHKCLLQLLCESFVCISPPAICWAILFVFMVMVACHPLVGIHRMLRPNGTHGTIAAHKIRAYSNSISTLLGKRFAYEAQQLAYHDADDSSWIRTCERSAIYGITKWMQDNWARRKMGDYLVSA